jgi:hypothetical protein
MKKLSFLGLAFLMAFTITGCQLYFGDEKSSGDGACLDDGYYVDGDWVSAQCPGGGNKCASDTDCAAGCDCDLTTKTCVETGFCSTDKDCPTNFQCDARSTCTAVTASCNGAIAATCTNGAPKCAQGSVPLIDKGCYFDKDGDGQFDCSAITQCAAPPACQAYQYSADCAAASCTTVQRGFNCTMGNGQPCTGGQTGCTCQTYQFDHCEPTP